MHIDIRICMSICSHERIDTYMSMCLHIHIQPNASSSIHVCSHILFMCTYIYLYKHICIYNKCTDRYVLKHVRMHAENSNSS